MGSKTRNRMMVLTSLMIILLFCVSTAYADAKNERINIHIRVENNYSIGAAYEAAMTHLNAIDFNGLESLEPPDSGDADPNILKKFLPPPLAGFMRETPYSPITGKELTLDDNYNSASLGYARETENQADWDEIEITIRDIGRLNVPLYANDPHPSGVNIPGPKSSESEIEYTIIKGYDATIYRDANTTGDDMYIFAISVSFMKTYGMYIYGIEGGVKISRGNKEILPQFGEHLKENDIIETRPKGRLYILIDGINHFCIYETARVKVVTKIETETRFKVFLGKIRVIIRKLKGDFNIDTPTTAIGVRGTDFLLEVEKDGTSTVTVVEGVLEVSDLAKEKTVFVKAGECLTVKPGELPTEPVIADSTEIDSLRNN